MNHTDTPVAGELAFQIAGERAVQARTEEDLNPDTSAVQSRVNVLLRPARTRR